VFSLFSSGCSAGAITTETIRIPESLDAAGLGALLPTQGSMETLLGVKLESETMEGFSLASDTDMENVPGYFGSYTRIYRSDDITGSGYVALALFGSAVQAEATVPDDIGSDPARSQQFDLGAPWDKSRGWVVVSDSSFTFAEMLLDRLVVQLAVFHDPDDEMVDEVRSIAGLVADALASLNN
jgi:hypothetical protein